jgi:hypothetical protein
MMYSVIPPILEGAIYFSLSMSYIFSKIKKNLRDLSEFFYSEGVEAPTGQNLIQGHNR